MRAAFSNFASRLTSGSNPSALPNLHSPNFPVLLDPEGNELPPLLSPDGTPLALPPLPAPAVRSMLCEKKWKTELVSPHPFGGAFLRQPAVRASCCMVVAFLSFGGVPSYDFIYPRMLLKILEESQMPPIPNQPASRIAPELRKRRRTLSVQRALLRR